MATRAATPPPAAVPAGPIAGRVRRPAARIDKAGRNTTLVSPATSRWLFGTCLAALLLGAPLLALAGLALAEPDNDVWGIAVAERLEQEIRARERLHYGLHLGLGRVLSLCPCTIGAAARQYAKAGYHAHTTRQRALVTTERPRTARDAVWDAARLAGGGLRWAGDRLLAWSDRPAPR